MDFIVRGLLIVVFIIIGIFIGRYSLRENVSIKEEEESIKKQEFKEKRKLYMREYRKRKNKIKE